MGDFAKEYADSLYESTGHIALIADRDIIVAVAGVQKEFLEKPISRAVEQAIEDRKVVLMPKPGEHKYCEACPILEENGECQFTAQVIAPIIAEGDPIGAVILTSKEPGVVMGNWK